MQESRATTTSSPTSRRSSRSVSRQPSTPASRRSGSASIPGSASARRSSRTPSSCGVSTCSSDWGGPCSSASRASARSGGCLAIPMRRPARSPRAWRQPSPRCERCDYPSRARRQGDGRGADGGGDAARMITIELHGLELHGFHGVLGEEQRLGQPFLFDVWLDAAEPGADRIEDALDYRDVAACVADVSERRELPAPRVARGGGRRRADGAVSAFTCARPRPKAGGTARRTGRVLGRHRRAAVTRAFVGVGANLGDRQRRSSERSTCYARSSTSSPSRRFARPLPGATQTSRPF